MRETESIPMATDVWQIQTSGWLPRGGKTPTCVFCLVSVVYFFFFFHFKPSVVYILKNQRFPIQTQRVGFSQHVKNGPAHWQQWVATRMPPMSGSPSCVFKGQLFADCTGLSMPLTWPGRRLKTGPLAE